MNKIVYGTHTFTDHEIESGNVHLATNLISAQLEANTFTAVVRSSDATLINFERNAKLIFYIDDKQTGIFYVQSISRVGSGKYKIDATSAVGLLIEGQHMGGIYTGQTAQALISDICGTVPFIVKENMAGIKLYGWLPIASRRDNLSQVLFAIGAALKTDMDGILRINGLWDGISAETPRSRMYDGGRVEYGTKVTQVVLTEHQYSEGGETKKLFEGTAQAGDIITFNSPMYNLSASGFSIQSSGANWARVSGGDGTLTGREYIHNTRLITRNVQAANTPNVKTVEKATLISFVNSSAAADRLVSYFKCNETIASSVVYSGENTGNVMSVYHPFDKTEVNACLQSADITLSKTMKADEKSLAGFEPLQYEDVTYDDTVEVITSSRTWTVPNGVKSVRAVLIGGGTGGQAGQKGSDGANVGSGSLTAPSSSRLTTKTINAGNGGGGGGGGSGSIGGKIYSVSVPINGASSIQISIGSGGSGGSSNGASGSSGGNTTISVNGATYSSGSGSSSESGYLEIVSGVTYADRGGGGRSGASGGSGYTPTESDAHDADAFEAKVTGGSGSGIGGYSGGAGGKGVVTVYTQTSPKQGATYIGGAGGGGASYGGSGGSASGTTGGPGASGSSGYSSSHPGRGGNGGNGGGGGGGAGGAFLIAAYGGTARFTGRTGGTGGSGGAGGTGAPGCVILYYGIPKKTMAGQFVDKNGKQFLDKITRKFVV